MKKIIFLIILLVSIESYSNLQPVQISFQTQIPQSRWFLEKDLSKISSRHRGLALLKKHQFEGRWAECGKLGRELYKTFSAIRPWILVVTNSCDIKNFEIKKTIAPIRTSLEILKKQNRWLSEGPYSSILTDQFIQMQFIVLDSEIRNKPQQAWQKVGEVLDLQDKMKKEDRAKIFRMAGELAFLQQNFQTARAYILRSLTENEDPKLRERLNSVEGLLKIKLSLPKENTDQVLTAQLLGEEKQKKIIERMTQALQTGDLFSAVKDGVDLIEEFPGSIYADWASERIIESYMSVASQDDKKFKVLRFDFIDEMKNSDARRLQDWAARVYRIGQYRDSSSLLLEAYSQLKSSYIPVGLLDLLAKSYMHLRELDDARKIFSVITQKYSGTREFTEAHLNLGFISFLKSDFSKAQSHFEKVIAMSQFSEFELIARYWLWRSAQKTDATRAKVEVQVLIEKFPFSYYGLRAISETNNGQIDFSSLDRKVNLSAQVWMTPNERASWERLNILIAAGWIQEARSELEQLPDPTTPDLQVLFARYYAASLNYPKAIQMFNKAWDENSDLRALPIVRAAYPKEFFSLIEASAKERKIDPILILSLIRQESSFLPTAESSSGALGLMQIIPPTAQEVANMLKIKNFSIPQSVLDPQTNIKMGTFYFQKMLNDFDKNVPMALAAYNAGPTRLKRWLDSSKVSPQSSSSPEYEIWIDMMPWGETRFYVKAILRNYLMYQLVDNKKIQVLNPVWPKLEM